MPRGHISLSLGYERRVFLSALLAGSPAVAVAIVLIWSNSELPLDHCWELTAGVLAAWIVFSAALRNLIVFPLQTVSNLMAALREGDFSVRGRQSSSVRPGDVLEELTREVNALAETVHEQRLGAVEATALLRKVMEEIGVAVFAFDGERRLQLLNRAAERLLNIEAAVAIGRTAASLGLEEFLDESGPRLRDASFAGSAGRWEVRRTVFRQGGRPHQLLVLSDLTRALREEELLAWQRIVRVIGHEINNSLAPIKSISESLQRQFDKPNRAVDWEDDFRRGLSVIGSRSEALARFMTAYARLARMPQPRVQTVEIGGLVRRVAELEKRIVIELKDGPAMTVSVDPDQLEQLLINLLRNAVDASMETGGGVAVTWRRFSSFLEVCIEDEGHGLSNTANLFVPFFTTKPGGSGIGLVLSRQIAEAHGGSLTLRNRAAGQGCAAYLRLPLSVKD